MAFDDMATVLPTWGRWCCGVAMLRWEVNGGTQLRNARMTGAG